MERQSQRRRSINRPRRFIAQLGATGAICASVLVLGAAAAAACTTNGKDSHHGVVLTAQHINKSSLTGTIGTIGTTSFTLTDKAGTIWTVMALSTTPVTEAGQSISYSALSSGEKVRVSGSLTSLSAHTFSAAKVAVVLARIKGTVVSTLVGGFQVSDHSGLWRVVVEEPSTTYYLGPMKLAAKTTPASIVIGSRVDVLGTVDANHTSLDAVTVRIDLSRIAGSIVSTSGSSFVVSKSGAMITVATSPSTIFSSSTGATTISALVVGAPVVVFGTSTSSTSFAGSFVFVSAVQHRPVAPVALSTANVVLHQLHHHGGHLHHFGKHFHR